MKRNVVVFVAFLSLSSLFTGCDGVPSVETVGWEIQRRFPKARFEREEHFRLGRIKMGLLRGLLRMVPGKVEKQEFLARVHGLEVVTYRVRSLPDLDRVAGDTRFEKRLREAGWTMMVRTRDEGSHAWVFLRSSRDGSLRGLFVVDLGNDELSLVRIDGLFDRAFAEVIANHPRNAIRRMRGEDGDPPRAENPAG